MKNTPIFSPKPHRSWRSCEWRLSVTVLGMCSIFFASCRSTYQNLPLTQDADQPRIIIVRKGFWDFASPIHLYQNGQLVGRLSVTNRYLAWQAKPGEVFLEARSAFSRITYRINAQPTGSYYLEVSKGVGPVIKYVRLKEIPPDQVPDLAKMKPPKINYSQ